MNPIKALIVVLVALFLIVSCQNSGLNFIGQWKDDKGNNVSISKNGESFLITGSNYEGIYTKTQEGNLSGSNGFVLISYDNKNKRLIVNVTGSNYPIHYWSK